MAPAPWASSKARALGVVEGPRVLERLDGRAAHDGDVVAGEAVLLEQLTHLELDEVDEVEQLGVVHQVDLVHEDHQRRHAHLAGEQDVLARLGHGAVGGRHDQDAAVHLRGARDHVLYVVGVTGAVHVRVVAVDGLVLDVGGGDRHRLGRVAHRAALGDIGVGLGLREALGLADGRDGRRERGLAVVHVPDRADVDVRLGPLEDVLGHRRLLLALGPPRGAARSVPGCWLLE